MLDGLRSRAHAALARVPGRVGEGLRKVNEALGRPLADAEELEDRKAFVAKGGVAVISQELGNAIGGERGPAPAAKEAAPVIVYFMDKQKRDVGKLTDVLDANGVTYTVTNIQEDPAAQYAVKRDSKGARLPVVFVAGECLGGREQLINAASSGALKKKVFG